ncbi:hypothetical protein [Paenibacillus sp. FSL R7-0337]|uniref:hypothetical protein n=1 Tax=Paenibacillus sp. FSL R7-0337 TaxID=1926588 RepID=UPI00096C70EE|nr:hypothetical protein [Paenibacillus sp. FSL R7-0337]OMG00455.1 hypothetical protein BK147_04455 [Paenibacillus sp. FSL R7-0337]
MIHHIEINVSDLRRSAEFPSYHRSQIGLNHLAFHANSREQVDELTRLVRSKGMNILYEDKHPFAGGEH